jgi:hypothetical protein
MALQQALNAESLIEEIERYPSAVDAFRAAGCEPRWLAQSGTPGERTVELAPAESTRAVH